MNDETRLQRARRLEREAEGWADKALLWVASRKYSLAIILILLGVVIFLAW